MATRKNKERSDWSYADEFDRLMGEHFGEGFKTEWNLFAGMCGGYCTVRTNGKKLTKAMARVGRTISDALAAGRSAYE